MSKLWAHLHYLNLFLCLHVEAGVRGSGIWGEQVGSARLDLGEISGQRSSSGSKTRGIWFRPGGIYGVSSRHRCCRWVRFSICSRVEGFGGVLSTAAEETADSIGHHNGPGNELE